MIQSIANIFAMVVILSCYSWHLSIAQAATDEDGCIKITDRTRKNQLADGLTVQLNITNYLLSAVIPGEESGLQSSESIAVLIDVYTQKELLENETNDDAVEEVLRKLTEMACNYINANAGSSINCTLSDLMWLKDIVELGTMTHTHIRELSKDSTTSATHQCNYWNCNVQDGRNCRVENVDGYGVARLEYIDQYS